jgi:hypothetical protein
MDAETKVDRGGDFIDMLPSCSLGTDLADFHISHTDVFFHLIRLEKSIESNQGLWRPKNLVRIVTFYV